ncbi:MAG: response regulator [Calditrichia bacterium]
MEKSSEVFAELKNISKELEMLEEYVRTTLNMLENNFRSFVQQIDLLSELVEFQREVANGGRSGKMIHSLFDFISRSINFEHGFIALKLKENDEHFTLVSDSKNNEKRYQEFIESGELELLLSLCNKRDLAFLVRDIKQLSGELKNWKGLKARSAIVFPVRVRGKLLGLGLLVRHNDVFQLKDLSFINLILGQLALLVYQHYYFERLRKRLYQQFRLRKVLEEIKFSEIFDQGSLLMFSLDSQNRVLYHNAAVLKYFSLEEDHITGFNFLQLLPAKYQLEFQKAIDRSTQAGVQSFRAPVELQYGRLSMLQFYLMKMSLKDQYQITQILAIDITDNYYKEVTDHRNELLNEMDQFSRTLVGELSNLLTLLLPNLSYLRSNLADNHPHQRYLENMEKAAHRSENLVQKFLNYDLEEFETSGKGNLNTLIKDYIREVSNNIPKHIEVSYELDPGIKQISYFPLRLKQLLKILVENAINALEDQPDGRIVISTKMVWQKESGLYPDKPFYLPENRYILISIYDSGSGIAPQSLPQVFKPFYSTRIKNEGVGLGLFIAYNIVKDLKGHIFMDSKPEQFTTVDVFLPMDKEQTEQPLKMERQKNISNTVKRQPTVLVVDDEYNIRTMMREIMEMSGLKVYTAGNGREGVELYRKYKDEIDLVILDMLMPVMDGRAAFKHIHTLNPKQKVFIISGYSQKEDLDDLLAKGAVGFMRKPFQVKEIISRINEILEKE